MTTPSSSSPQDSLTALLLQSKDLLIAWSQHERERETQIQTLYASRRTPEEVEAQLDRIERERVALLASTESLLSQIRERIPS